MTYIICSPLFWAGLFIRSILIYSVVPDSVTFWYAPFLENSIDLLPSNPWNAWAEVGGDSRAYPYGYGMWLAFAPLAYLCSVLGVDSSFAFSATLILVDFFLLYCLTILIENRKRLVILTYWLSPIVIFASYGMGFNDLVPTLYLTLAVLLLRRRLLLAAGGLLGVAVSAKLSMLVTVPIFLIYFLNNRPLRSRFIGFLKGFLLVSIALWVPFFLSTSATSMLVNNSELGKIFKLSVGSENSSVIYLFPLIYFLALYAAWRIRRINFELFMSGAGIALLFLVIMTPGSPGWFVWCIPFLIYFQAISDRVAVVLVGLFSMLFLFAQFFSEKISLIPGAYTFGFEFQIPIGDELISSASIFHTGLISIGLLLCLRMLRDGVSRNDFFKLSRKPFAIGIAGDSGSGKDTFASAIEGLFGGHSVVHLSGDDYHRWDRQKPMWQVMTHLNPLANNLEEYCSDLRALVNGKSVSAKRYNHANGLFSKPIKKKSRDYIIASGLHALYLPISRMYYDLAIYLDIDETLRRHFKLQRDVLVRGHTIERTLNSIAAREADSHRFIKPQSNHADLIFSLRPVHEKGLCYPVSCNEEVNLKDCQDIRLKLVVTTKNSLSEGSLHRILVGLFGLHVDMSSTADSGSWDMMIEGDVSASDIALAARSLCPEVLEFLDTQPDWQDGVLGLMQLITLSHISQALTRRYI